MRLSSKPCYDKILNAALSKGRAQSTSSVMVICYSELYRRV
ncbi:MAG: hypothetical protein ACTS73_03920 [Arsenophonus sp. NEOnobi-MAG3]